MEVAANHSALKTLFSQFRFLSLSVLLNTLSITAMAGTSAGTLPISALVTANCSFNSVNLNFGNYDPIIANVSTPLTASTSFQIACTKGANVTIVLNNGLYSTNASGTTRAMSSGPGHYLSYELYSNAGDTTIWNNTVPVRFTSSSSSAITETVYGKIPAGQNAFAGNYSDTVVITATF